MTGKTYTAVLVLSKNMENGVTGQRFVLYGVENEGSDAVSTLLVDSRSNLIILVVTSIL